MKRWIAEYGQTFDIEGLVKMRLPDAVEGHRNGDGFRIVCPFGHEHASGDPGGAWVLNGDDETNFRIRCSHNTCLDEGRGRDTLEMLKGWLLAGRISREDLEDEELGGGRLYKSRVVEDDEVDTQSISEILQEVILKCRQLRSEGIPIPLAQAAAI